MKHYSGAAVERAMKVHEVIMRAMSGELTWFQAAEIIGISPRQMQRWNNRWENHGYEGMLDRRRQPSPKRSGADIAGEVLRLYREQYFDFTGDAVHLSRTAEQDKRCPVIGMLQWRSVARFERNSSQCLFHSDNVAAPCCTRSYCTSFSGQQSYLGLLQDL